MSEFKKGQVVWVLEEKNYYRKTAVECIRKCVYQEKNNSIMHNVKIIRKDGVIGMGFSVSFDSIFSSLDDLKSHYRNK